MSSKTILLCMAACFYSIGTFALAPIFINSVKSRNNMNFKHSVFLQTDNNQESNNENNTNNKGPLSTIGDMFANFDDVIDDFFYKRMGKGEIFYGKRKYKPSGTVDGEYNGFGLSDKLKIDMTREYREQWLEEKQMREEIAKLKREKEERNS